MNMHVKMQTGVSEPFPNKPFDGKNYTYSHYRHTRELLKKPAFLNSSPHQKIELE